MSDILIAQEVGTVVVIETAPAEIVEVVAVGPQGPVGDVNPQMPVILAATEAARDTTLATIGTAALKANNLSDLANAATARSNLGLGNVNNTSDANKPISTATQTALNAKENTANKGVANGYAALDATGKVPTAQLPSYVDDVLEYASLSGFPATGETGKIYVALDTNKTYRWSGSAYIYITSGAVDSVAGKTGVVVLAKADVGLGSVDNTSDADKPISTATQAALNLKANAASPTTSGTLTHSGDIVLSGSGKRITGDFSDATLGNRAVFQTSTVNGSTGVFVAPNGTGTASFWLCSNSSSVNNSSLAYIGADPSQVSFQSDKTGTGAYLPMKFYTGGSERMRIDPAGDVSINQSKIGGGTRLQVSNPDPTPGSSAAVYVSQGNVLSRILTTQQASYLQTTSAHPLYFSTAEVTHAMLGAAGGFLVISPTGLGYGTGAGGAVTQATSKSTTVALNKPTGQILMSNSALAAGATATFLLNNTLIMWDDVVVVSIVAATVPTQGAYQVWATNGNQGCYISLKNNSGVSLSDSLAIQFAIIKGTTA